MKYTLCLAGGVSVNEWKLEFTQPSNDMAIEYARKVLQNDPCAHGAHIGHLWQGDNFVAQWDITKHVVLASEVRIPE